MSKYLVHNFKIRLKFSGLPRDEISQHLRVINDLNSTRAQLGVALKALFPTNDWKGNLPASQHGRKADSFEELIVLSRKAIALEPRLLDYASIKRGAPAGPRQHTKQKRFLKAKAAVKAAAQPLFKLDVNTKLKLKHVIVSPKASEHDKTEAIKLLTGAEEQTVTYGPGRPKLSIAQHLDRFEQEYAKNPLKYLTPKKAGRKAKAHTDAFVISEPLVHTVADALNADFHLPSAPKPSAEKPVKAKITQADQENLVAIVLNNNLSDEVTREALRLKYPQAKWLEEIPAQATCGRRPISLEERYLQIKAQGSPEAYRQAQDEVERVRKLIALKRTQASAQESNQEQTASSASSASSAFSSNSSEQANPVDENYTRSYEVVPNHLIHKVLKSMKDMPKIFRSIFGVLTSIVVLDTTVLEGGGDDVYEVEECPHPLDKKRTTKGAKLGVATSVFTRIPILMSAYKGATSDHKVMDDFLNKLKEHGIAKFCMTEDRGMDSEESRVKAESMGQFYVQMVRRNNVKVTALKEAAMYEISQDQMAYRSNVFKDEYLHLTQGTAESMGLVDYDGEEPLDRRTFKISIKEERAIAAYLTDQPSQRLEEHITVDGVTYLNSCYAKTLESNQEPKWKRVYYFSRSSVCNLVTSCNLKQNEEALTTVLAKTIKKCNELKKKGVTKDSPVKPAKYVRRYEYQDAQGTTKYTYGPDKAALAKRFTKNGYALVTNLHFPGLDLNSERGRLAYCEAVRFIYACRWTAELVFRNLKTGINMSAMFSRKTHTYAMKLVLMITKEIIDRLSWFSAHKHSRQMIEATAPVETWSSLQTNMTASVDSEGNYKQVYETKETKEFEETHDVELLASQMNMSRKAFVPQ